MGRRRHTPEQIITALREAEVAQANGKTVAEVVRDLGISEQTYYRWRKEFGGMKVDQARQLKELQKENARLKRSVANLTLDKLILEDRRRETSEPRATTEVRRARSSTTRGQRAPRVSRVGSVACDAAQVQEGPFGRGGPAQ